MTKLKPIRDNVLGIKGDFGDMETQAGLIIKSNIGKSEGITPRWFQIAAVGSRTKASGTWYVGVCGVWSLDRRLYIRRRKILAVRSQWLFSRQLGRATQHYQHWRTPRRRT